MCMYILTSLKCFGISAHAQSRFARAHSFSSLTSAAAQVLTMKVSSKSLSHFKLDSSYSLLSARDVSLLLVFFKALDVRGEMALDGIYITHLYISVSMIFHVFLMQFLDLQFYTFMHNATDLSKDMIYRVFDMLDVDHSGLLDFDEFYLLVCILIAVRVRDRDIV